MAREEQVIYVQMDTEQAAQAGEDLQKELLVLRLAFGKLKAAIKDALAPLGVAFIPLVQKAVWASTRLVKSLGKVIAALFGQSSAAQNTAKSQAALAKANEKVKRSLAGFDEIDRLSADQVNTTETQTAGELSPQLQAVVNKILSLVAPLKEIDFTPAVEAFGRLRQAVAPISEELFAGLEWAWHNLLVPLAAWTIEDFLPAFLDTLSSALGTLYEVIIALKPAAEWLWQNFLRPIGQWAGEKIIAALGWLREKLDGISQWISENRELAQKIALAAAAILLVNSALGGFNSLGGGAIGWLSQMANPVALAISAVTALGAAIALLVNDWDSVKNASANAWQNIKNTWAGASAWMNGNLLPSLVSGFKTAANTVIGFINGLIAGVVTGINAVVGALNNLSFTVPNWVPGLGGKSVGFDLKAVQTPRIPYLAQGAVLPANKPFMAVVGDQKNGTNIEAPLETIKQALAEVLGSGAGETVVTVNFTGDLAGLARVLKPAIETETRRTGSSLAKGGAF